MEQQPRPPPALTTAVSWRSEGIKYRKNEVFLDVIENVNVLVRLSLSPCLSPLCCCRVCVCVVCVCVLCVAVEC
jgi:AP-1 complex subunit mu